MKILIALLISASLTGCAQLAQTAGTFDPRLGEVANNTLGIKNYRYEHVDGEPDQRLIIIRGSTLERRRIYKKEAVQKACPKGTTTDVLGSRDKPEISQMKVVVWCKK